MRVVIAITLSLASICAQASLLGRAPLTPGGADYQAYYDDALNITWMADANLAATNAFGVSGVNLPHLGPNMMVWTVAQQWIAAMNSNNYLGVNNWRLPQTTPLNGLAFTDIVFAYDGSSDLGYNIGAPGTLYAGSMASEMAHLYYVTLGNTGLFDSSGAQNLCGSVAPIFCLTNPGPFTGIQNDYWTGTPVPSFLENRWAFFFDLGYQPHLASGSAISAWAVADGDPFAVVPIPAAVWLFGGALGLLGMVRRRSAA